MYLTEILQCRLQESHPHRPTTFGALFLIIPDLRTLAEIFVHDLNLRLQQLLVIQEVLKPVVKESLSTEGRAYELLSNDTIKHICEGISLEEYENRNNTKTNKKVKNEKKKKITKTKGFKTSPSAQDFTFFKPPSNNDSNNNIGWSLRADIYHDEHS